MSTVNIAIIGGVVLLVLVLAKMRRLSAEESPPAANRGRVRGERRRKRTKNAPPAPPEPMPLAAAAGQTGATKTTAPVGPPSAGWEPAGVPSSEMWPTREESSPVEWPPAGNSEKSETAQGDSPEPAPSSPSPAWADDELVTDPGWPMPGEVDVAWSPSAAHESIGASSASMDPVAAEPAAAWDEAAATAAPHVEWLGAEPASEEEGEQEGEGEIPVWAPNDGEKTSWSPSVDLDADLSEEPVWAAAAETADPTGESVGAAAAETADPTEEPVWAAAAEIAGPAEEPVWASSPETADPTEEPAWAPSAEPANPVEEPVWADAQEDVGATEESSSWDVSAEASPVWGPVEGDSPQYADIAEAAFDHDAQPTGEIPVIHLSEPESLHEPEPTFAFEPEPTFAFEPEPEPEFAFEPEPEPEFAFEPEPEPEPDFEAGLPSAAEVRVEVEPGYTFPENPYPPMGYVSDAEEAPVAVWDDTLLPLDVPAGSPDPDALAVAAEAPAPAPTEPAPAEPACAWWDEGPEPEPPPTAWWDEPMSASEDGRFTGRFALGGFAMQPGQQALGGVTFRIDLDRAPTSWTVQEEATDAPWGTLSLVLDGSINCSAEGLEVVMDPGFAPTTQGFTVRVAALAAGPFAASGSFRVH